MNQTQAHGARVARMELTPLNHRVSARFARCGDSHVPGNQWVTRWTGKDYRTFPVCKTCRVPMIPRKWRWADNAL